MDRWEMDRQLQIGYGVSIPLSELLFRFSRSGGPGGQNVNKVSTRVELLFDVRNSPSLTDAQKDLLIHRLKSHVGVDGILTVSSQESRSQWRNRELVVKKFIVMLTKALRPVVLRKASRPNSAARQRRIEGKKLTAIKKKARKKVEPE